MEMPALTIKTYNAIICLDSNVLHEELERLLTTSTLRINHSAAVAVDIEFCALHDGEKGPLAGLVIVANQNTVLLIPLAAYSFIIPNPLLKLFNNDSYIKFFVNPAVDLLSIRNLIGGEALMPLGILAIDTAYTYLLGSSKQRVSLREIALALFGSELDKERDVRCGAWQDLQFCRDNVEYAALDAIYTFIAAERLQLQHTQEAICLCALHVILHIKERGEPIMSGMSALNLLLAKLYGKPAQVSLLDDKTGEVSIVVKTGQTCKRLAKEDACKETLKRLLSDLCGL